jgi:hypothetical protein
MGQTCFMSVILQTVVHNPFIRNFFLAEGHKTADCERESCVSCALDEMIVEFHSAEKTEGYGAVAMLMGSWLAGEVGRKTSFLIWQGSLSSRHSLAINSRTRTSTCNSS